MWDDRTGRMWWVDIVASMLHCFDPSTGQTNSVDCDAPSLSLVVPTTGDGLVVAVESGLAEIDPSTGATTRIADLSPGVGIRLNDGNVDPQGRLWVGSMAYDFTTGAGALYRVENGSTTLMVHAVTCSNGIGWSPNGEVMYFVDTPTQQIVAYDFDGSNGTIHNKRPFVEIDANDGGPDGIAIDTEGGVWVALWNGAQLRRYDAAGRLAHVVATEAMHPTCPEFGGSDLNVLYFTAAADDDGSGGGLFRVDEVDSIGVRGLRANRYNPST